MNDVEELQREVAAAQGLLGFVLLTVGPVTIPADKIAEGFPEGSVVFDEVTEDGLKVWVGVPDAKPE